MNRRIFLHLVAGAVVGSHRAASAMGKLPCTTGWGDVKTPTFYRHDIGTAPGRFHEPSGDSEGNLWTSPLDGNLWRYHTPTGTVEILDLKSITGFEWKGLHLWPVAHGSEVYLCCPSLPQLWVYNHSTKQVQKYDLPYANPEVYGGFSVPPFIYFYDTRRPAVIKWNPKTHTGTHYPCPYLLSGTLYMTFADAQRDEIWGSTYTGDDLVRFDIRTCQWSGHWKSPGPKATPTPANSVFGETLYISDHLNGRLLPFNIKTGEWGPAVPIPGYREWFGYVSGGWVFRGLIYMCHSTWIGGNDSIDGKPHHFLGSWTVFDPSTKKFSRLDIPTQEGESFMSDYALTMRDELFLLAVNMNAPRNAVILRTSPPLGKG
jgi:hypothetical protein